MLSAVMGLAAAGLSDDPQRLALTDREGDPVDRPEHPHLGAELGLRGLSTCENRVADCRQASDLLQLRVEAVTAASRPTG